MATNLSSWEDESLKEKMGDECFKEKRGWAEELRAYLHPWQEGNTFLMQRKTSVQVLETFLKVTSRCSAAQE